MRLSIYSSSSNYTKGCDKGYFSQAVFHVENFADVVSGKFGSQEPQPYAILPMDDILQRITFYRQKNHLDRSAFGRAHRSLPVMEPSADENRSAVPIGQTLKP